MTLYRIMGVTPDIDETVFIAPGSAIIGNVRIGKNSSVWFNSVLRGDSDSITIGEGTNIQDLTVCHTDPGSPLIVGDRVTVGHRCVLHGCLIEDDCLIGMGAVVMNGARIGRGSIIAAGSVILENTTVPEFSLVAGGPGKVKRTLDEKVLDLIGKSSRVYIEKAEKYLTSGNFSRKV